MSALEQINPVNQVQKEIADILRNDAWFKAHNVTIVEQNSLGLKFLMQKSIEQLKGVVVIVGCDGFSNDYPALEMDVTIQCIENILMNRIRDNSATALDVCQAAIDVVDGEWWHFGQCRHECPEDGVLIATADFKGLVKRVHD